MISADLEAKIRRLFHAEKWSIGTIGRHLQVHHSTVGRTLRRDGVPLIAMLTRKSKIDPFVPFVRESLEAFPDLAARVARVLYQMVKGRGYDGGSDHFHAIIGRYRPKKAAEAYLRLSTLPGEQAKVDRRVGDRDLFPSQVLVHSDEVVLAPNVQVTNPLDVRQQLGPALQVRPFALATVEHVAHGVARHVERRCDGPQALFPLAQLEDRDACFTG